MKIRANRPDLADALSWVATVIPRKPQAPALSGVKITATETDELTLQAFNYDASHTVILPVEVHEPGHVLLTGHLLREVVSAMSGSEITLEAGDASAELRAGRATFRAQLLNLDEYPSLPEMPPTIGKIDAEHLTRIVRTVKHAVDDGAPIPGIRGLRLEVTEGRLYAVGLDSSHGSAATAPWSGEPFDCQVPVRAFEPAAKGMTGEIHVGHTTGLLGLADDTRMVTLRTLSGQYGDWARLMRAESPGTIVADRAALLAAVKRAAVLDSDAPVWLIPQQDGLEVASGSQEAGDFGDVIDATLTGDLPAETAFSVAYLTAALAASDAEQVEVGVLHQHKAVMLRPSDGLSQQVVMPRRAERTAR